MQNPARISFLDAADTVDPQFGHKANFKAAAKQCQQGKLSYATEHR